MQFVKTLFLLSIILTYVASPQLAAQDFEDVDEYGIPKNRFPTAPGQESATAVINFNLDAMGLNVGKNHLHTDEASQISLSTFYNPYTKRYHFEAKYPDGEVADIQVVKSDEKRGCLFVWVGPRQDWVNIICSDTYLYDWKGANQKKSTPVPIPTSTKKKKKRRK